MEEFNQEPKPNQRIPIHHAESLPSTDNNVDFDKPYIKALLNPSMDEVKKMANESNWIFLDIGCGNPPRLSVDPKNDLVIACEPTLDVRYDQKTILVRKPPVDIGNEPKKLVVFKDYVERIANRLVSNRVFPDIFTCVAPNPADVAMGEIFNDETSMLIDPNNKLQIFIIALERTGQTHEGLSHLHEAHDTINDWMENNGFRKYTGNPGGLKNIEDKKISHAISRFHPNSGDLRERKEMLVFFRNPLTTNSPSRK